MGIDSHAIAGGYCSQTAILIDMPTAALPSAVPKGTAPSRPGLKMAAGSSTDHQTCASRPFPGVGKGMQKQGEARTQNGLGLRLSKRKPADDTFLGVSDVAQRFVQQNRSPIESRPI
jgi:hypothetical protein